MAEIVESALRDHLDVEGDAAFRTSTIGAVLDAVYHETSASAISGNTGTSVSAPSMNSMESS